VLTSDLSESKIRDVVNSERLVEGVDFSGLEVEANVVYSAGELMFRLEAMIIMCRNVVDPELVEQLKDLAELKIWVESLGEGIRVAFMEDETGELNPYPVGVRESKLVN